jgi:hypothetical protein
MNATPVTSVHEKQPLQSSLSLSTEKLSLFSSLLPATQKLGCFEDTDGALFSGELFTLSSTGLIFIAKKANFIHR